MNPQPSDRTDMKAAVDQLDLDPIKVKLMDGNGEHGWSREYTNEVERWYKRFLYLTQKYPDQPIVVTEPIDEFWHQHILDTRKYAADCEAAFGRFLHHFPYFGMRGADDAQHLQDAFDATLQLIEREFGESLLTAPVTKDAPLRPVRTGHAKFKGTSCSDCSNISDGVIASWAVERPSLT